MALNEEGLITQAAWMQFFAEKFREELPYLAAIYDAALATGVVSKADEENKNRYSGNRSGRPVRRFKDSDGIWRDEDGRFAPSPKQGKFSQEAQSAGLAATMLLGGDDENFQRVEDVTQFTNAVENLYRRKAPLGDRTVDALAYYSTLTDDELNNVRVQLNVLGDVWSNPKAKKARDNAKQSLGGRELSVERMLFNDPVLINQANHRVRESFTSPNRHPQTRRDMMSEYLALKASDMKITQALTGKKMPSVGSIVDNETGKVRSLWIGEGQDKYWPFDVKEAMKAKGNTIVRSRLGGGLTEQDIFWGLTTNAREVAVSNPKRVDDIIFTDLTRNSAWERVKVYRAFKSHKKHLKKMQEESPEKLRELSRQYGGYGAYSPSDRYYIDSQGFARERRQDPSQRRMKPEDVRSRKQQLAFFRDMSESAVDSLAIEMLKQSHPENFMRRIEKHKSKLVQGAADKADEDVKARMEATTGIANVGYAGRKSFGMENFTNFKSLDDWEYFADQIEANQSEMNRRFFEPYGQKAGQDLFLNRESVARARGGESEQERQLLAGMRAQGRDKDADWQETYLADVLKAETVEGLMAARSENPKYGPVVGEAIGEGLESAKEMNTKAREAARARGKMERAKQDLRRLQEGNTPDDFKGMDRTKAMREAHKRVNRARKEMRQFGAEARGESLTSGDIPKMPAGISSGQRAKNIPNEKKRALASQLNRGSSEFEAYARDLERQERAHRAYLKQQKEKERKAMADLKESERRSRIGKISKAISANLKVKQRG